MSKFNIFDVELFSDMGVVNDISSIDIHEICIEDGYFIFKSFNGCDKVPLLNIRNLRLVFK